MENFTLRGGKMKYPKYVEVEECIPVCPNCGEKYPDAPFAICPRCGSRLKWAWVRVIKRVYE